MDRRQLLTSTLAIGTGALALTRCTPRSTSTETSPPHSLDDWAGVRAEFSVAPDRIHMASFFLASHPRTVREAIEKHRRGLDDNPVTYLHENVARCELAVRDAASKYFGVDADELAMTDSTTMGLGIVYSGFALSEGQEVLTSTHDHIVTYMALDAAAKRSKASINKIALYDDPAAASEAEIVARLEKALTPKTRLVAMTWVHSGTGVKLPLRAMSEAIERANQSRDEAERIIFAVDGVHGFGVDDVSAAALGVDFFVAGCHKWIFGPRGTGMVWGRPRAWARTQPMIPSIDPFWRTGPLESMPAAGWMTPGGFHSFEHRFALAEAFQFHLAIGKARVASRIHELNRRCKEQLAKLPKVRVKTPMKDELSAGIICFEVDGLTPEAVVAKLAEKKIVASVTPPFYTPLYARLAPSLLTMENDVDRTVEAVAAL